MDGSLLGTLRKIKLTSHIKRCSDDDFVDRINNFYTPLVLALFTIVICTKSYIVGEPLQCWVPVQFSKGWESYAEAWCYIKNTYYIPTDQEIPNKNELRQESELQYYQWVPFVLGLQAALFILPSIFWKFSSWKGRLHLKPIIQRGVKSSFEVGETRVKTLERIADYIRFSLFKRRRIYNPSESIQETESNEEKGCGLFNSGVYLTLCYMTTKFLYVVNIIIQFIIVHRFLKTDFFFGFNMVSKFANGSDWEGTGLFPRVTMCDFTVPRVGQPISHSLQCVLVINLFNEKIYIFLWFWLAFIFILTIINWFVWIIRMLCGRKLSHFISIKSDFIRKQDQNDALKLCESDMNCDAYFVLRMIDSNCGMMTTRRITENILNYYQSQFPVQKYSSLPPNYHELNQKEKQSSQGST